VKVEIFSDVACPFCFIGKRNLERALEAFPHAGEVEVIWRSFQLDPDAPAEPVGTTQSHLAEKYGVTLDEARAMGERVRLMARGAGLELDFDRVVHVNTFDAHRILTLAGSHGKADGMAERLFTAYFVDGGNIADPALLLSLAAEEGLDGHEARAVLSGERFADEVRADFAQAVEFGLSGVPAFVIDRAVLVSGAQPPEVLLGALQQAGEPQAGGAIS
jgi:predicted DsbA family dithiol-disulfide isomerase